MSVFGVTHPEMRLITIPGAPGCGCKMKCSVRAELQQQKRNEVMAQLSWKNFSACPSTANLR
jgi:hypothetical protein